MSPIVGGPLVYHMAYPCCLPLFWTCPHWLLLCLREARSSFRSHCKVHWSLGELPIPAWCYLQIIFKSPSVQAVVQSWGSYHWLPPLQAAMAMHRNSFGPKSISCALHYLQYLLFWPPSYAIGTFCIGYIFDVVWCFSHIVAFFLLGSCQKYSVSGKSQI